MHSTFEDFVLIIKRYPSNEISMPVKILSAAAQIYDKNLSGDEIANVNFFTTISHTYFKITKKRTYFV